MSRHYIRIIKPARDIREGRRKSPATERALRLQAIRDSRNEPRPLTPAPVVMVIDDDVAVHDTLRFILRARCTVLTAFSAEEAIAAMTTTRVELVFLDLALPGMDGMEALSIIKDRWPAVPVTIVSESCEDGVEKMAMELGAFHFMRKEFDFDWMNNLLSTALDSVAAFRETEGLVNAVTALTRERNALADRLHMLQPESDDAVNA